MRPTWGFHPNITLEGAIQLLLEKGKHGSYICRRSEKVQDEYRLSVRKHGTVSHFKILKTDQGFSLHKAKEFRSVPYLIEYYRNNFTDFVDSAGDCIELIEPLPSEDLLKLGLLNERWYAGYISMKETTSLLKQEGESGSYFIRESSSEPGSYALAVRLDGAVIDFIIRYKDGRFHIREEFVYFTTIQSLLKYYVHNDLFDVNGCVVPLKEPLFDTIEKRKTEKELQKIQSEFEALQEGDRTNTYSRDEGLMPENIKKNRYKSILPFDHTRVLLQNIDPNTSGSDYINASYISDDKSGLVFIATQGCLKTTFNDFWHMINQENSGVIIMLVKEIEAEKMTWKVAMMILIFLMTVLRKCVKYWPEFTLSLDVDGLVVKNVNETVTQDYIMRQLEITEDKVSSTKTIHHFQFIAWPEHGVPSDPGSLLEFIQQVEITRRRTHCDGPPVVHCSAGIGRTGIVVVISILMHLYQMKGMLEDEAIFQTVRNVRLQRLGMVQTKVQYGFVYKAMKHFMQTSAQKDDAESKETKNYDNLDNHVSEICRNQLWWTRLRDEEE
ncbi:tyrosine-protein phosphatase non-receptor type 11-like isoform X2 [Hydractinia symbiolongicarpus]|uniref:tyrosine-protein phosphatase non-receptor type 11-like isoform X2 n=1 Tax=Hydractinia symbiolongicarpus TaxID=13093 RepID=UPI00254CEA3B|nr:tyrosine-protein phosphatase non-receptor type 11-like isoform X2 [Hydractinia symbiolongicarpus]